MAANRLTRKWAAAASCAALLGTNGLGIAQTAPAELLPMQLARQVAQRTIELVEAKALLPREQAEYARAKADLLALLDRQAGDIDRRELFAGITTMLRTLDVDGHSFILSPERQKESQRTAPDTALLPPSFRLVTTARGMVLRWTPPQIVNSTIDARAAYLKRFHDEAAAFTQMKFACALVVDLTEQKGGNAWPPFIAMHPLFGVANKAYMVDRNRIRTPFVDPSNLKKLESLHVADRTNPLARFANLPLAVVVDRNTASAGEMLLVALLGEGERVQTFGHTSRGLSTGNMSYSMADGSQLALTERRYAIGDQPVYRGGIPVAQPAASDESEKATVKRAAEWAARQSPLCVATPQGAAATE